ncbi:hypothetical protein BUALT_Bualt11G0061500 [Buddleja alternifolia]|uniref:Uncharacterized protein n=1 Tax=Buddleja alternifolia TaxID=168488 RepID=A0AAV6WU93_9LAMI|nr:hypothetical protein BUALT_Bualt11G0061500 [Buddleja alternifolia]
MEYLSQPDILYTNGWQYEHDRCFISAVFKGRGRQQLSLDTKNDSENPLVRAFVWNGEPVKVQFNAIFGPTIINVSSDSSRSYGKGWQSVGTNETLIVEDSEEAVQIPITLENPLPKKGKGLLDQYSSSQGSSPFPPPLYGYATLALFPIPQYNLKIKETADDDPLDETTSSTDKIMSKLLKDHFLSPSKDPWLMVRKQRKKRRRNCNSWDLPNDHFACTNNYICLVMFISADLLCYHFLFYFYL